MPPVLEGNHNPPPLPSNDGGDFGWAMPISAPTVMQKRLSVLLDRDVSSPIRAIDLLLHLPFRYVTRQWIAPSSNLEVGIDVLARVQIIRHQKSSNRSGGGFRGGNAPHVVLAKIHPPPLDATVSSPFDPEKPYKIPEKFYDPIPLRLVFFNNPSGYVEKILQPEAFYIISGRLEVFKDSWQIIHPEYLPEAEASGISLFTPVYRLTEGLTQPILAKQIAASWKSLTSAQPLPEWQDVHMLQKHHWPSFLDALQALHYPKQPIDTDSPAQQRLLYDEVLALQLALALGRAQQKTAGNTKTPISIDKALLERHIAALPFALTEDQKKVLRVLCEEIQSQAPMMRLIQGDVGSGKTILALLAARMVAGSGMQTVILAPTEILAQQHLQTCLTLYPDLIPYVGLLTGKMPAAQKRTIRDRIQNNSLKIIFGTHAVFQEAVQYKALRLVIVDEQHRFGVSERIRLTDKGQSPDYIVMTATPIPRTLQLTFYGDLSVSQILEKPAGRKPIQTKTIVSSKIPELVAGLKRQVASGAQVYWVCPLVEESDNSPLTAATTRFETLKADFGERVGLIHGRLTSEEKTAVLEQFIAGKLAVLVATTVIEVGVNVPAATIMVIEHAERFGLAQLHQLRGRVGRGSAESTCILLYDEPLSATAKQRLQTLKHSEDGFWIAEKDLELRGSGELLGTRQSGEMVLRTGTLGQAKDILEMAHKDVDVLLNKDPHLMSERGRALRVLLQIFEHDSSVALLRSG